MQDILVVVDMQNDFIDGTLGTKEAVAIVPKVEEKIRNFKGTVLFTRDTHETWYLDTQEGKKLPVPHCIRNTEGWQIRSELDKLRKTEPIDKDTFGSTDLADELVAMNIDDDIGSIKVLPYNYDDRLKKKGIKCIKFNKYRPFANVAYNNRDHRKIVVIDGYIGYTGGINIADEYCNYIERFGHWKDTGIRLYGEAVETLTFMFIKSYNIFGNEKLKYANYGSNKYLNEKIESCGYFQPFGDGPAPIDEYYIGENAYMNMINQATKYLYITTPYLIVDHELSNALCNAALRGVDVRIITPGIPDKKIVNIITKNSYGPLIKAGVKIYEYTPGFIHAKSMIADDKCAIIAV